jgi:hypothetical protein
MLIAHPPDDSSMTDTLRMGARLLQHKFQHLAGGRRTSRAGLAVGSICAAVVNSATTARAAAGSNA